MKGGYRDAPTTPDRCGPAEVTRIEGASGNRQPDAPLLVACGWCGSANQVPREHIGEWIETHNACIYRWLTRHAGAVVWVNGKWCRIMAGGVA